MTGVTATCPLAMRLSEFSAIAHQLLGVGRPDTADHPGAEVFLDAVERNRLQGL